MIRARRDEIAIHGPVVVFAKGEAVGGMVIPALGKRDEVGGIDEADVVASGKLDAKAAGGALVIVDGEYLTAEGGRAAVFEFFLGDEKWGSMNVDCWFLIFDWKTVGKVTGNEGLSHELAVGGNGDEVLKAIGEAGEDLAKIASQQWRIDRAGLAIFLLPRLPESLGLQVVERVVRRVFVVVFPDDIETNSEAVADFLAPRDALGSGQTLVDEIECDKEQQGLVRSLVALPRHADDADIQVVEAFDSGGEKHGEFDAENQSFARLI